MINTFLNLDSNSLLLIAFAILIIDGWITYHYIDTDFFENKHILDFVISVTCSVLFIIAIICFLAGITKGFNPIAF